MEQVTKGKNIDASKITFSQPRILDNGAKLVYVNYSGGRFSVQTPLMDLPWAMSAFTEGVKFPKYSLTMSFRGMDDRPEIQAFHDRLLQVENAIIDGGVSNSVAWFKKKNLTKDVVKNLFNPIVKVSCDKETGEPDGKYPPTMRIKVPKRDGLWEFKVQSKSGEMYNINDPESNDRLEDIFVKNCKVQLIIQCVGLWIASGNYMCQWKVTRAKVDVPETSANANFLPDSDVEDDDEDADTEIKANNAPQMLDDSDEEEVEINTQVEEEPVVEVQPEKPKKKRIVKKKTT